MGKISSYARVLAAKLADVFVVDQTDNGTTATKSATVEQIGTAIGTLQNFADLDTSNKNLVGAINEIGSLPDTSSGSIATFTTTLTKPLVNCECEIVAQGGGGTPSSPISIVGYTGMNVTRCGSNLWNEDWEVGNISTSDGQPSVSLIYIRSKVYCACKGGATYYCKSHSTSQLVIYWYGENDTYLGFDVCTNTTKTAPANAVKFKIRCEVTTYSNDISINYPATDTTYHAYNADSTTYPISWQTEAGTIYGGSLNVTSGVLTVTWGSVDLSNLSWSSVARTGFDLWTSTGISTTAKLPTSNANPFNALCTDFAISNYNTVNGSDTPNSLALRTNGTMYLNNGSNVTTPTGTLAYELATPTTYQLTPTEIETLVGTNNVFHDCNGNTSVTYLETIKEYIDKRVTP